VQQRSKLTDKQSTIVAQSHKPLWHKPALEANRILMVFLAATRAQAKGAAPSASCEGVQTEVAVTTPLNTLPPPSNDGVDWMYRQLEEIHAITATPLVECARWHWSDPTSCLVHTRAGWQRPTTKPFAARMAPLPPTDFSP
jgi:hypothetical protein